MALFPNPTNTGMATVHIEGLANHRGHAQLLVHDAAGHRVLQEQLTVMNGVLHHELNMGDRIAPGLYVVQVITGKIQLLRRLVIQ